MAEFSSDYRASIARNAANAFIAGEYTTAARLYRRAYLIASEQNDKYWQHRYADHGITAAGYVGANFAEVLGE